MNDNDLITEQDLIEAVMASMEQCESGSGMTGPEIANMTGLSIGMTRKRLATLIANDKVEVVKVKRKTINGIVRSIYAYKPTGR